MGDAVFFTGIERVEFPISIERGEKVLDRYYITNNRSIILEIIRPFEENIGTVEFNYLKSKCPYLMYRRFKSPIKSFEDFDKNYMIPTALTTDRYAPTAAFRLM